MDFEEALFDIMRRIAERHDWDLTKRDPGPDCEYCDYYDHEGFMPPIHECPQDVSGLDERIMDRIRDGVVAYNAELIPNTLAEWTEEWTDD